MGGGGAVVAIAAAAHAKRRQDVVDAFRLAEATAPERARSLADLSVEHHAEVEELVKVEVLVPGLRAGTLYLSEPAYVAHRDAESRRNNIIVVALLVGLVILFVVAGYFLRTGNS